MGGVDENECSKILCVNQDGERQLRRRFLMMLTTHKGKDDEERMEGRWLFVW